MAKIKGTQEVTKVYNYVVTHRLENGHVTKTHLDGTDRHHAREEASYECEGEILYVRRGNYMGYDV